MSLEILQSQDAIDHIGREMIGISPEEIDVFVELNQTRPLAHFDIDNSGRAINQEQYGLLFNRAQKLTGRFAVRTVIGVTTNEATAAVPLIGIASTSERGGYEASHIKANQISKIPSQMLNRLATKVGLDYIFDAQEDGSVLLSSTYVAANRSIAMYRQWSSLGETQRSQIGRKAIQIKSGF